MTRDKLLEYIHSLPDAVTDKPFREDFDTTVARHGKSRTWFALIMNVGGRDMVNLKCDPQESEFLRKVYEGVIPAYHMNKVHWNSVYLNSDVPEEEIERMVRSSFELTAKKSRK
ncbi:MAG: MmcQ/YjbR family DNA-binding protein [Oscillospiraceae bacterium]